MRNVLVLTDKVLVACTMKSLSVLQLSTSTGLVWWMEEKELQWWRSTAPTLPCFPLQMTSLCLHRGCLLCGKDTYRCGGSALLVEAGEYEPRRTLRCTDTYGHVPTGAECTQVLRFVQGTGSRREAVRVSFQCVTIATCWNSSHLN